MKPVTVAISIAVLALPLYAEDQHKQNTTTTTLSAPASAQAQDSALVRAAKAAGQVNKKATILITNETLRSGGFAAADVMTEDPEAKTRRDAAAMTLQRLKNSSSDYYRTFGEPPKAALPQAQPAQTEGQRMSTTQPSRSSTTEPAHSATTRPSQMSTTQAYTTSTTQPTRMSTTQPQATPVIRPQP